MPAPQPNSRTQTRDRPTYNDLLWEQAQDIKTEVRETRKELNARMDRIEQRMDKLEQRFDKLDAKIDAMQNDFRQELKSMHNELKSSTGHISIANISTVGIALGVLYSILSK